MSTELSWTWACGIKYYTTIKPLLTSGNHGNDYCCLINGITVKTAFIPALSGFVVHTSLPYGLTTIEEKSFQGCDFINSIDIPNSITEIGNEAFASCSKLYIINIPQSVKNIGNKVFANCDNLTTIRFNSKDISIGEGLFEACPNLKSIFIPIDSIDNYQKLWPSLSKIFIEFIGDWIVESVRTFDSKEKALVKRAEVVPSKTGYSVCFFMISGGTTYIPLLETSKLSAGDSVNIETARLVTLRKDEGSVTRILD